MTSHVNEPKKGEQIPNERFWVIATKIPLIKKIRQYNLEAFSLKQLTKMALHHGLQYVK